MEKNWNGKAKKNDFNGNLRFEGEYKNGKKGSGKGKEYNDLGKLIFDGKYLKEQK